MSNIKKLLKKDISYPEYDDPNFQSKIYKKREFYYHKIPELPELKTYKDIKNYRDNICGGQLKLYEHQSFLANFINPNTPYKGLLIFHGVGTGKTGSAVSIAENFKDMVKKYNTKIHILVPGPLMKENWKNEIIKFTSQHIFKDLVNKLGYMDENEEQKAKKNALKESLFFYKIMTHRSFYKKVLGDKIKDLRDDNNKKYRTNEKGEIDREDSIDKIENLDNTVLIVDEVHNFTGNEHGDALNKIISKSKNLRLILLSATPMKNLGDDIIEIINYLRPQNYKIRRDKVFTSNKDYKLDFKPDGKEYLHKMCSGYISYYRGANPLLFAKKNDIGEVPPGLKFTKCVRCKMNTFQFDTYVNLKIKDDDPLERIRSSVANCVIPVLSDDKAKIIGMSGETAINRAISNLKSDKDSYLKKLNAVFFKNKIKNVDDILYQSTYSNNITGLIFKKEYLKTFSTKFYEAFTNINNKVEGKEGSGTIFVYSNLVKVGIEIFQEILLQNGYLEFKESQDYIINNNTIDYKTGIEYKNFDSNKMKRPFYPATFIKITGKSDDLDEDLPEEKSKILNKFYNNLENVEGRYLKIILGSRVMNEGITLENTSAVHILDVYYNFGRIDQTIGRAIRQCKHYKITSEKNPYPEVKIFKYVISLDNNLSSDENLYRKAELKYILIKQVERILKESSIDCAVNYNGNVFKNEISNNKKCEIATINKKIKNVENLCPQGCDFMECDYTCYDKKLNLEYYDQNSNIYKKITRDKLDYNTFIDDLAKNEIISIKSKIIELYKFKYVYTLREIIDIIRSKYTGEQYELFDELFVYKALDQLVPTTKNDHINFKDTIYDMYNIPGYLIYRGTFYIFQPHEQDEGVPLFYRKLFNKNLMNKLSLNAYLENNPKFKEIKEKTEINTIKENKNSYDFKTIISYYQKRDENSIVGIIDKFSGTRKLTIGEDKDIFKIRDKIVKQSDKKRGEGISSLTGAVCYSSKDKKELKSICDKIKIDYNKKDSRVDTCENIKNKLLYLEKYTSSSKKITYMIIPYNHKIFLFPYNLEDRIKFVENKFNELEKSKVKFKTTKGNNGIFMGKRKNSLPSYKISFSYSKNIKSETEKLLNRYNFTKSKDKWISTFE